MPKSKSTTRTLQFEPGKYYHIYNRGVNKADLFYKPANYYHFLRLYNKYVSPVADTFAYCLLKNHFHLLIRAKQEEEIELRKLPNCPKDEKTIITRGIKLKDHYRYFSDLFNAYSQAFNKQENRTGPLFERPFHRIEVDSEEYFRQLVIYIHTNPEKHRFTTNYKGYAWSSYGEIISLRKTKLNREKVIGWFNDKAEFISKHNECSISELKGSFWDL